MSKVEQLRVLREARALSARKHGANTTATAVPAATVAVPERAAKIKTAATVVSGSEFKSRVRRLGITLATFASHTGTPKRTVEEWSRGASSMPGWVDAMLHILESSGDAVTILADRAAAKN